MPSLSSIIPEIAPFLELTPAALYERQRALVRLKLLPKPDGRGRGSGAELTSNNLAALVISVLAARTLSEVDRRVVHLCDAKLEDGVDDPNMAKTFRSAVAALLMGNQFFLTQSIRVSHSWRGQLFAGHESRSLMPINFYTAQSRAKSFKLPKVRHTTEIEEVIISLLQKSFGEAAGEGRI